MSRAGRNEPYPSGSTKKARHCRVATPAATSALERAHRLYDIDQRVIKAALDAMREADPEGFADHVDRFMDGQAPDQLDQMLLIPWIAYHSRQKKRTPAAHLVESGRLTAEERAWIEAQHAAWLSVWEVVEVRPGHGMALKDLLTGAERFVYDRAAAQSLQPRVAILARVVEWEDLAILVGTHKNPLAPSFAQQAVDAIRSDVLKRKRAVPTKELRDPKRLLEMVRVWRQQVAASVVPRPLPTLLNFEGDPIEWHSDCFDFDPARCDTIWRRLAELKGAHAENGRSPLIRLTIRTPKGMAGGDLTTIAQLYVQKATLRVETNSRRRADLVRARVEQACGDLLRHRSRETNDGATQVKEKMQGGPPPSRKPMPPKTQRAVRLAE